MSILYKNKEDVKYSVKVDKVGENLILLFSCDGGKFGTDEILDEITISPKKLLDILQNNNSNE